MSRSPNPGWDSNPLLLTEKQLNGRSASNGFSGLGALFDGTGFLGTGLFVTGQPWGVGEYGLIALAVYLVFFQGQNKRYRGDWSERDIPMLQPSYGVFARKNQS